MSATREAKIVARSTLSTQPVLCRPGGRDGEGVAGAQGAADGGVSADAMGTFLTWMQERKGQAFIVATCNDVGGLSPEMLRKGGG